jgi:hypothetical protein
MGPVPVLIHRTNTGIKPNDYERPENLFPEKDQQDPEQGF